MLKTELIFADFELEELVTIGDFIGRYQAFFKKIYKAFATNKKTVTDEPMFGAPVIVEFSDDNIIIKRAKTELHFCSQQFLKYMELIDLCFTLIIPLGSIIDLDLDVMPDASKVFTENRNQGRLAMIIAQKVPLQDQLAGFYTDYLAVLWPFGVRDKIPPFFVSNMMVKNVIHTGMTSDTETEFTHRLTSQIVSENMRSIVYMNENELMKIKEMGGVNYG